MAGFFPCLDSPKNDDGLLSCPNFQEEKVYSFRSEKVRNRKGKNARKKQPQRGLGVAQLEKLRLEEQSKQEAIARLAALHGQAYRFRNPPQFQSDNASSGGQRVGSNSALCFRSSMKESGLFPFKCRHIQDSCASTGVRGIEPGPCLLKQSTDSFHLGLKGMCKQGYEASRLHLFNLPSLTGCDSDCEKNIQNTCTTCYRETMLGEEHGSKLQYLRGDRGKQEIGICKSCTPSVNEDEDKSTYSLQRQGTWSQIPTVLVPPTAAKMLELSSFQNICNDRAGCSVTRDERIYFKRRSCAVVQEQLSSTKPSSLRISGHNREVHGGISDRGQLLAVLHSQLEAHHSSSLVRSALDNTARGSPLSINRRCNDDRSSPSARSEIFPEMRLGQPSESEADGYGESPSESRKSSITTAAGQPLLNSRKRCLDLDTPAEATCARLLSPSPQEFLSLGLSSNAIAVDADNNEPLMLSLSISSKTRHADQNLSKGSDDQVCIGSRSNVDVEGTAAGEFVRQLFDFQPFGKNVPTANGMIGGCFLPNGTKCSSVLAIENDKLGHPTDGTLDLTLKLSL